MTIYTGSPNFSKASENSNDENVLRSRVIWRSPMPTLPSSCGSTTTIAPGRSWDRTHEKKGQKPKAGSEADPLVLKKTRDEWVKGTYKKGTKSALARERGL